MAAKFVFVFCLLHLSFGEHVENKNIAKVLEGKLMEEGKPIEPVMELDKDHYLVDLDMIMTKEQYHETFGHNKSKDKRTVAIRQDKYRWTNGVVPYVMDYSFKGDSLTKWFDMINFFHKETCLKFVGRQRERNYIYAISKKDWGCMSAVGMQGGMQNLYLEEIGCRSKGTIFHETMHALGIYHEQERPDRNRHVRVIKENMIHPDNYHNFEQLSSSQVNTYGLAYDFASLLHYDFDQFGKQLTGWPNYTYMKTIQALKDRNAEKYVEGQTERGPSFLDVALLNKMYKCGDHCRGNCPAPGFFNKRCECITPKYYYRQYCRGDEKVGWCLKYKIETQKFGVSDMGYGD